MTSKESFENKLKEIVKIDDTWEVKTFDEQTIYYTFLNNNYCVSRCKNKNNMISFMFSKLDFFTLYTLYQGFVEEELLKRIEDEVHKSKN